MHVVLVSCRTCSHPSTETASLPVFQTNIFLKKINLSSISCLPGTFARIVAYASNTMADHYTATAPPAPVRATATAAPAAAAAYVEALIFFALRIWKANLRSTNSTSVVPRTLQTSIQWTRSESSQHACALGTGSRDATCYMALKLGNCAGK